MLAVTAVRPTSINHMPNEGRTMSSQSFSPKISQGLFDKLGEYEENRAKKRVELAREYEVFKKIDDERFRNRFANKRTSESKTNPPPMKTHSEGKVEKSKNSPERSDLKSMACQLEEKINHKLEALAKRIDALGAVREHSKREEKYESVESATNQRMESNNKSMHSDFGEQPGLENDQSSSKEKLLERLKKIQEAHRKLESLEKEYVHIRASLYASNLKMNVDNQSQVLLDEKQPDTSTGTVLTRFEGEDRDNAEQRLAKKEAYGKELRQQILETQQKRKQQLEQSKFSCCTSLETKGGGKNVNETSILNSAPGVGSPDVSNTQKHFISGESNTVKEFGNGKTSDCFSSESNSANSLSQNRDSIANKDAKVKYAEELKRQIEEMRLKKELQKKTDEEYDRKIQAECAKYDASSQMSINGNQTAGVYNLESSLNGDSKAESKYARGGHGIFGNPLTADQKTTLQKYKEDLALQIEEKRRKHVEQMEKEKEAERRESERLLAEQKKMQKEFEEERVRMKMNCEQLKESVGTQNSESDRKKSFKVPPTTCPRESALSCQQKKYQRLEQKDTTAEGGTRREGNHGDELILDTHLPAWALGADRDYSKSDPAPATKNQSSIIDQLKHFRERLSAERQRINNTLSRRRVAEKIDVQSLGAHECEINKVHPKVSKKGTALFTTPSQFDQSDGKRETDGIRRNEELLTENSAKESFDKLNDRKLQCLREKDNSEGIKRTVSKLPILDHKNNRWGARK